MIAHFTYFLYGFNLKYDEKGILKVDAPENRNAFKK